MPSDFVGIIPAAGKGTRLGLPYPKEIHSIEKGYLLIDYALEQLSNAGIDIAYVVTSTSKISELAKAIGYERRGVRITYVEKTASDSRSMAGSVMRGCRRANYTADFTKYVVLMPDVKFGDEYAVKKLIQSPLPSLAVFNVEDTTPYGAVYGSDLAVRTIVDKSPVIADDYAGCWGAFTLDELAVGRIRNLMRKTPASETGDEHLIGDLIAADEGWSYVQLLGGFTDLGDWKRINGT